MVKTIDLFDFGILLKVSLRRMIKDDTGILMFLSVNVMVQSESLCPKMINASKTEDQTMIVILVVIVILELFVGQGLKKTIIETK